MHCDNCGRGIKARDEWYTLEDNVKKKFSLCSPACLAEYARLLREAQDRTKQPNERSRRSRDRN